MAIDRVVALVGGVGGAKLAFGLAQSLPPECLTIIVNTGDDFWNFGLRVCPDLDTIMYTLSGLVDKINGWGVAHDSTQMLAAMKRYGEDAWFRLGDQDLATHILRTHLLREGWSLTAVTRRLASALGIGQTILPMTDDPVATMVDTAEYGELDFQTYFVRYRWQPTIRNMRLDGIEPAAMTDAVRSALADADTIIIGPSNPWLSIDPILSVPGMREAIKARAVPRVAVTPIVAGAAVKGPAAKIMAELGYNVSPETVVDFYGDVLNGFVYDERDASIQADHLHTIAFDTIMTGDVEKQLLAQKILDWIGNWS